MTAPGIATSKKTPQGLIRQREAASAAYARFFPGFLSDFRADVVIDTKSPDVVRVGINIDGRAPISCMRGEWTDLTKDEARHVASLMLQASGSFPLTLSASAKAMLDMLAMETGKRPEALAAELLTGLLEDDFAANGRQAA